MLRKTTHCANLVSRMVPPTLPIRNLKEPALPLQGGRFSALWRADRVRDRLGQVEGGAIKVHFATVRNASPAVSFHFPAVRDDFRTVKVDFDVFKIEFVVVKFHFNAIKIEFVIVKIDLPAVKVHFLVAAYASYAVGYDF